nr:hypothetical protein [Tanacetum cinerariifolium]
VPAFIYWARVVEDASIFPAVELVARLHHVAGLQQLALGQRRERGFHIALAANAVVVADWLAVQRYPGASWGPVWWVVRARLVAAHFARHKIAGAAPLARSPPPARGPRAGRTRSPADSSCGQRLGLRCSSSSRGRTARGRVLAGSSRLVGRRSFCCRPAACQCSPCAACSRRGAAGPRAVPRRRWPPVRRPGPDRARCSGSYL